MSGIPLIGNLFKAPEKIAPPAPPPPPPTSNDAAKIVDEQNAKRKKASGYSSTILTSGQGVVSGEPVTKKTLLGG